VVRSDAGISSLAALRGKRVNLGTPGSPQHRIFSAVMNAKGWSAGDFSLVEELTGSQSVDALAFCHGTIQAMLRIGVHPDAQLMQLTRLCGARLIDSVDTDVDNLIRKDAVYSQVAIAAGTYPTQPQRVSAIGTRVLVIASADLGERTAYRIIEAMADGRRRIESAHPALAPFDETSGAGDPLGIMLHPGVSQFLDERRP
jgi:hypothetical protein